MGMSAVHEPQTLSVEKSAIRKISIRLVPFVALMFFINYLDRTAIGFAAPSGMNADLGLSAAQFGFASGIFFLGYIVLEVPSNLALNKFGARRWLARIMISWGIVAVLFTFVQTFTQLTTLRFLLGVAEAGFFPGAILFLSMFVPARYRSGILGLFYLVINGLMLYLAAYFLRGLSIDGCMPAILGGLIIAVLNWIVGGLIPDRRS